MPGSGISSAKSCPFPFTIEAKAAEEPTKPKILIRACSGSYCQLRVPRSKQNSWAAKSMNCPAEGTWGRSSGDAESGVCKGQRFCTSHARGAARTPWRGRAAASSRAGSGSPRCPQLKQLFCQAAVGRCARLCPKGAVGRHMGTPCTGTQGRHLPCSSLQAVSAVRLLFSGQQEKGRLRGKGSGMEEQQTSLLDK